MKFPNIEAERARLGLTKSQLARALQVSDKTLYNWEHSGKFSLEAVQKMSKLFNCSIDYLLEPAD